MALFGGGGWFYETIKCFDLETENHSRKSFAFVKSGKRFIHWNRRGKFKFTDTMIGNRKWGGYEPEIKLKSRIEKIFVITKWRVILLLFFHACFSMVRMVLLWELEDLHFYANKMVSYSVLGDPLWAELFDPAGQFRTNFVKFWSNLGPTLAQETEVQVKTRVNQINELKSKNIEKWNFSE